MTNHPERVVTLSFPGNPVAHNGTVVQLLRSKEILWDSSRLELDEVGCDLTIVFGPKLKGINTSLESFEMRG